MNFLALILVGLMSFLFQTEPVTSFTKNLNFLFAAYAVVWALIVGYLFSLSRRQKKLAQEIEMLKHAQQKQ